jgi:hypothetical protein
MSLADIGVQSNGISGLPGVSKCKYTLYTLHFQLKLGGVALNP